MTSVVRISTRNSPTQWRYGASVVTYSEMLWVTNIGGYRLDTRRRRCENQRAESAERVGFLGREFPPPRPTRGSRGASWAPPTESGVKPRPPTHYTYISGPQKPSSRNNALQSPKRRSPKIGGPVRPNASNMPKAGPGCTAWSHSRGETQRSKRLTIGWQTAVGLDWSASR